MRRRVLVAAAVITAGVAACADILGIDDGIPRAYDASLDVIVPDVALSDASTSDAVMLFCGTNNSCNFSAGEGCCQTGPATYECVDASAACTGVYIGCDGPKQCPQNTEAGAMQCCTNDILDDAGQYVAQSVSCVPEGTCTPVPTHYILCETDADCPAEAGCGESVTALPPFLICK